LQISDGEAGNEDFWKQAIKNGENETAKLASQGAGVAVSASNTA
jgi:hypothetical protein